MTPHAMTLHLACSPQAIPFPTVAGAQFLSIEANLVTNLSSTIPNGGYPGNYGRTISGANFCNVSLVYTHPGLYDKITTEVWLPTDSWNNALQGSGGAGYQGGLVISAMLGAVAEGFAVVSTDSGHTTVNVGGPPIYVLNSDGSFNDTIWNDYAYVTLSDSAFIGKAVTESFFGTPARYSYFNGCSGGGRQALELAQRYPDLYDGILALAPAINVPSFLMGHLYPNVVYDDLGQWPHPCEVDALTNAAIAECDGKDGVWDGIISSPELCDFDPSNMVGSVIACNGQTIRISPAAAAGAAAAWSGARAINGSFLWHNYGFDAPLTGPLTMASTICNNITGVCSGSPWETAVEWLQYLVLRNPHFNFSTLTHETFDQYFELSRERLNASVATDNPNLNEFQKHGGKMIMWHGLADQIIPVNGSRDYYERVARLNPNVKEFFRFFEAPGVEHCLGGVGPFPGDSLQSLRKWVESGTAPEVLDAVSPLASDGSVYKRQLCLYPKKSQYNGSGDVHLAESYTCV